MANNHVLFSSLYENPLAAGASAAEPSIDAACHGRLVDYLLRDRLSDDAGAHPAVESLPHVPPRAELAAVESLPHVPPRAEVVFAGIESLPHVPPRAWLPTIPPRAHLELAPVSSIPALPPRA